jgi:5-methylcytosine-specific restriction enzyme subunit McrC
LAHELAGLLAEMPESPDIGNDFRAWKNDRLMAHYTLVKPWCELILGQYIPMAVRGAVKGVSLLFPMEKLFEQYVESQLKKQLPAQYWLQSQARSASLCWHDDADIFQLRPDYLVRDGKKTVLAMDAKWKLINSVDRDNKYGLSQSDFYQMFAYGHKYLGGEGDMMLIMPLTELFDCVLPSFDFSADLRLWVTPFDLVTGKLAWPPALSAYLLAP